MPAAAEAVLHRDAQAAERVLRGVGRVRPERFRRACAVDVDVGRLDDGRPARAGGLDHRVGQAGQEVRPLRVGRVPAVDDDVRAHGGLGEAVGLAVEDADAPARVPEGFRGRATEATGAAEDEDCLLHRLSPLSVAAIMRPTSANRN